MKYAPPDAQLKSLIDECMAAEILRLGARVKELEGLLAAAFRAWADARKLPYWYIVTDEGSIEVEPDEE